MCDGGTCLLEVVAVSSPNDVCDGRATAIAVNAGRASTTEVC